MEAYEELLRQAATSAIDNQAFSWKLRREERAAQLRIKAITSWPATVRELAFTTEQRWSPRRLQRQLQTLVRRRGFIY
jgi:hypothetical protein